MGIVPPCSDGIEGRGSTWGGSWSPSSCRWTASWRTRAEARTSSTAVGRFEIEQGEEGGKFKLEETFGSDALLLGRVTYEGFAAAWPERDGEFADKFNTMPKYVVSSTLTDPQWTNSHVLGGDLVDEITKLKGEVGGDIVVHGSARLAQGLLESDLVDELRLMVFPVCWEAASGSSSRARRSACA